jgi:hypothetical protein
MEEAIPVKGYGNTARMHELPKNDGEPQRTAVILQPCFFPWRGQFDLYSRADVRVFLDDVQFSRGTWYNRNRIMTPQGPTWITVPIRKQGSMRTLIKDMPISDREKWQEKILGQLQSTYRKTPFFSQYWDSLDKLLRHDWRGISDLAMASVRWSFEQMGRPTTFRVSSELGIDGDDPVERLLVLCRELGATRYLSGPAAKDYIGEGTQFRDAGIDLQWMQYPQYPKYRDDEGEEMSILDLLFRKGPEAPHYIWKES